MAHQVTPESEIKAQSIQCYNQWKEQWRDQAKYHGERFPMYGFEEFENIGVGKACLCIANGYSFEENIETIKKYQDQVDIIACDKTLKHCIDNGIRVDYCIICDANVSFETYLEPIKDKLQDTIALMNVTGAKRWIAEGNWKKTVFYVNQDVLKSEKEFMALSSCKNTMVAATNVSNQMVVALTQSINNFPRNFFGYDKYLLIGFDYCWQDNYYAFDKDGDGKANYMKNIYLNNIGGKLAYTSTNLMFSARWFNDYLNVFKLPVIQCSKRSIVQGIYPTKDLAQEMQYSYCQEDSPLVRKLVKMKKTLMQEMQDIDIKLNNISVDHRLHAALTA